MPVASQGTNYNGNKSIGWPIQAVLWLEWATSPPQTRLSLGAQPRDLQFNRPFVEMFFDRAQRRGEPALSPGVPWKSNEDL